MTHTGRIVKKLLRNDTFEGDNYRLHGMSQDSFADFTNDDSTNAECLWKSRGEFVKRFPRFSVSAFQRFVRLEIVSHVTRLVHGGVNPIVSVACTPASRCHCDFDTSPARRMIGIEEKITRFSLRADSSPRLSQINAAFRLQSGSERNRFVSRKSIEFSSADSRTVKERDAISWNEWNGWSEIAPRDLNDRSIGLFLPLAAFFLLQPYRCSYAIGSHASSVFAQTANRGKFLLTKL